MIERILGVMNAATSHREGIEAMAPLATMVPQLGDDEIAALLGALSQNATSESLTPIPDGDGVWKTRLDLLTPIVQALMVRDLKNEKKPGSNLAPKPENVWSPAQLNDFEMLYFAVPPDSELRNHLLRWLATTLQPDRLMQWARLMGDQPPEDRRTLALAFAPLMDAAFAPPAGFLDALVDDASANSQVASAIYDLCNFFYRHQTIDRHPAEDRLAHLDALLGQLSDNLLRIESGQVHPGIDPRILNLQVSDSVALIVSLCDMFALLKYEPAADNIVKAMSIRHRRVQAESAAALARLGYPQGKQALIALAQDPVSRLRVLAYAAELDILSEISLELQGDIATAESELAIWLASPENMGLSPSRIKLVDSRELAWPGYEEPVQCFLFQFWYGQGDDALSNYGISGPLTHAFSADLRVLGLDDVYSLFAGWQTVHQEIYPLTVVQAEQRFASEIRRVRSVISEHEIPDLEIHTAAMFFGELAIVGAASRDDQAFTVVADQEDVEWISQGESVSPIDWSLGFAIWQGRRLLATFNREGRA